MRVLLILLGVIAGAVIAWILNKFFAGNIKNKTHRIGLQVVAYIVFILLGLVFTSIFSLRIVLDKFIVNRIQVMEDSLSKMFPNSNIMEMNVDTKELVSMNNQIQQSVNDIDTRNDSFFERLVYDAFIGKLSSYINAVDSGVTTLAAMSNEDGTVTIKVILFNLKDMALNTISPYFVVGQIIILILFIISLSIYFGIILYIKKGGSLYNKSIVYGDVNDT
jgi:hypothetical protein